MKDVKSNGYLQVDETTIKVLDEGKKGKTHLGYYWVYHSPIDGNVVFDYQPTRGQKAPRHMLNSVYHSVLFNYKTPNSVCLFVLFHNF